MSTVNMCNSRHEILEILKKEPCTVDVLSARIGISPTAVRQHLTILEKESLVKGEAVKEGIGRPKVTYTMTKKAEELFPKNYDLLAEWLIREIIEERGEKNLVLLFRKIGEKFSKPYLERVQDKPLEERVKIVADIMNEWGAYACAGNDGDYQMLQNFNCSFYEVAQKHPQVCAIHEAFLEQLLEKNPERIACMAEGDSCCTFQVKTL